jgi:hypothetical protein
LGAPPGKAGIAIGTGSTLPLVMSIRNSARTERPEHGSIINAAKTAPANIRQLFLIRVPCFSKDVPYLS